MARLIYVLAINKMRISTNYEYDYKILLLPVKQNFYQSEINRNTCNNQVLKTQVCQVHKTSCTVICLAESDIYRPPGVVL